jgi:hypothetical protein
LYGTTHRSGPSHTHGIRGSAAMHCR